MSIVSLDPDDAGRLLQVNQAVVELTGYSEQELLAGNFLTFTHRDHRDRYQALWVQVNASARCRRRTLTSCVWTIAYRGLPLSKSPDAVITSWNPGAEWLYGHTAAASAIRDESGRWWACRRSRGTSPSASSASWSC